MPEIRRKKQSQETVRQIIIAARAEFAIKGLEGTRMDDIAKRSGRFSTGNVTSRWLNIDLSSKRGQSYWRDYAIQMLLLFLHPNSDGSAFDPAIPVLRGNDEIVNLGS